MTADQLFQIHLNILSTLGQIQKRATLVRKDLLDACEAQARIVEDGLDHARDEAELTTQLELHSRDLLLRDQLYAALQRISDGTFGLCERCEEDIDPRRLEVHPTAVLCFRCQSKQERDFSSRTHPSSFRISPILDLDLSIA